MDRCTVTADVVATPHDSACAALAVRLSLDGLRPCRPSWGNGVIVDAARDATDGDWVSTSVLAGPVPAGSDWQVTLTTLAAAPGAAACTSRSRLALKAALLRQGPG
jgi:hypothetical protein